MKIIPIRTILTNKLFLRISLMIFGLILVLLLGSCSYRYIPYPDKDLVISDDYAIWNGNGFAFAVSEQMWIKDPQYLSDHYTTFFVKIQNNGKEPMVISRDQFALLDEDRNQIDAVASDDVLDMMMNDETLVSDKFAMSIERQQEILQKKMTIQRNITTDALHFGEILPRASKQGYVFFPRLKYNAKSFTLVFKNKEIVFHKMK